VLRCLPALWFPSNWSFHAFYGGYPAAVILFLIGIIPASAILGFSLYGHHRTALILASLGFACVFLLIFVWALDCDQWFSAAFPEECGQTHCDNDGSIRISLATGGAITPLTMPLLFASVFALIRSLRQIRTDPHPVN
jgi:hypothetical protein